MKKSFFLLLITALLYSIGLDAQTKTVQYEDTRNPRYVDITVEAGKAALLLEAFGADGGYCGSSQGGVGAKARGYLSIGDGPNQVPVGSTIRLIPGEAGNSYWDRGNGGGGGGGTAVACKVGSSWHLLLVAGGGGGAGSSNGREGNFWENGSNGKDDIGRKVLNGGEDGNGGGAGDASGGGGYKISMHNGIPTGFLWDQGGTFGFGNGGYGTHTPSYAHGGGGGGYSGGGGGVSGGGGGGGGSYINQAWISYGSKEDRGNTNHPKDGKISYQFLNKSELPTSISVRYNSNKCIHTKDDWRGEGAWLELWDCMGTTAQQWMFEGLQIKALDNTNRCVTIQNADDTNGTRLILWGCHGDDHQQWVYDGVKRLIRSKKNLNKCFALGSNSSSNGTAIQIRDCSTSDTQQWYLNGATTSPTDDPVQTIRPAYATNKCFHSKGGSTANGANVELWDCLDTEAQQWYFNGSSIKSNVNKNKCLDLLNHSTTNGSNIAMWDCNEGTNQQWIYDGLTKSIRSGQDPSKCIHIKAGSSDNGANVELWDCLGTVGQQFEIK